MKQFLNSSIDLGSFSFSFSDILAVLLVYVVAQIFVWIVRVLLNRLFRKTSMDEGKTFMITRLLRTIIYIAAFSVALETIGIDLTVIWAGSAALLVGVGIGLQNFFNDVVSGFVLLFEGGVRVGDELEVDGMLVRVERIDLRSTRVITRYGNLIVMPNGLISGQTVRNYTQGDQATLLRVEVGVAYGSDVERVKDILMECANNEPKVMRKEQTSVLFKNFGDSALEFSVLFWVEEPWLRQVISSSIRFEVDKSFRNSGIRIPFPQRDVHLIASPPPKESGVPEIE
ncbi:MAG: mechanosensitive ion channel [Flavobacteriales bacterium]|nr:mechanosensitive ion channel [Flavobacteriales bacterium]